MTISRYFNTSKCLQEKIAFVLIFISPCALADFGISNQITGQIIRTVSNSTNKNLFDNLIIPKLKIRNSSGKIKQFTISHDRRFLSLLVEDGSIRVWDLEVGVQRPAIFPHKEAYRIATNSKQQTLFIGSENTVKRFDFLTGLIIDTLPLHEEKLIDIAAADSDLLILSQQKLSLWDFDKKKLLWQKNISQYPGHQAIISPDKKYFALLQRQEGFFSSNDSILVGHMTDGTIIQTLGQNEQEIVYFKFKPNNHIEVGYNNGEILNWSIDNGQRHKILDMTEKIQMLDSVDNGIYAALLSNGKIMVQNRNLQNQKLITKPRYEFLSLTLLANGEKLITIEKNGEILLWDTRTGKELLQMITTKQGWTVIDTFGRFDSSEKGMANISWEAADQDIPLDNFSGKYYEPGLLATALTNSDYINTKTNAIPKGITLPPKLDVFVKEIKNRGEQAELTVDILDQGGGIEEVNLFHNDKVINFKHAVIQDKKILDNNKERRTMLFNLKPVAGQNTVKVVATNKMGIEGSSAETNFIVSKKESKPFLRIVTIGINEYLDKKLNLDYSIADAEAISQLLNEKKLNDFDQVIRKQLYNQDANKLSILSILAELSNGKQQDVLVVYFAGHGIAIKNEWYFLPYETTLQPNLDYFTSVGISASDLREVFADSKIQHILLLVDACYSGASIDSFRRLQNSQRHFSRDISKTVGITIVAATRKDQEAAELSDLGHGLFTYAVTKGMEGGADLQPKDNIISAHELADFSTKTIPVFSKKYLGSTQEPTAFTMGKDFIILKKISE